MADRTSANLFGSIFWHLSRMPPSAEIRDLTMRLWSQTLNYDFTQDQMDADKALEILGLAKEGLDPNYPEEGKVMLYANSDGSFREGASR